MNEIGRAADKDAGRKSVPGILIAAPASGSGKTVVSCGLMAAFQAGGLNVRACKCGPDYIDPMFHREVLRVESYNLDLFFSDEAALKEGYHRHGAGADILITEGVMGYYDGMALDSIKASAYHVAGTLRLPVILVVSGRGAALTLAAVIKGMVEYKADSRIRGVILNHISAALYPRMKEMLEKEFKTMGQDIRVLGYVPRDEVFGFESRHLGLVTPEETEGLKERLQKAGEILAETVDLDEILQIAEEAADFCTDDSSAADFYTEASFTVGLSGGGASGAAETPKEVGPRIAVARDRAFCFYYKDNLELLEKSGCRLVYFSPLNDAHLPDAEGILLGGGYPELYAEKLSANQSMCASIRKAIEKGTPCLAECGGFLYLHETLQDADGALWPMAGVIKGRAYPTGKLTRFGYVEISSSCGENTGADGWLMPGEKIKAHEFHYWDSTDNGRSCTAKKPGGKRSWDCIHTEKNLFAGFPHLYLPSAKQFAVRFVDKCRNCHKT